MTNIHPDPARYEAWYSFSRGRWISDCEFHLLMRLLNPVAGDSLLDVGCGTGHFSRRFAQQGVVVTGIDPDPGAIAFARAQPGDIAFLQGSALSLPFSDNRFDSVAAITSLCFVEEPVTALQEMWRVTRRTLVLGLLNRHSLLYRQRDTHASYRRAHWNTPGQIRRDWIPALIPAPAETRILSALFLPRGNAMARWVEGWMPNRFPWGGFIALALTKG